MKIHDNNNIELCQTVFNIISGYQLVYHVDNLYSRYEKLEFFYDHLKMPVQYLDYIKEEQYNPLKKDENNSNKYDLSKDFYDGFNN